MDYAKTDQQTERQQDRHQDQRSMTVGFKASMSTVMPAHPYTLVGLMPRFTGHAGDPPGRLAMVVLQEPTQPEHRH